MVALQNNEFNEIFAGRNRGKVFEMPVSEVISLINEYEEKQRIVGVCADICVISNVLLLKAHYPEMKIVVDASCCAGSTPDKHKMALEVMKSCQIDVIGE